MTYKNNWFKYLGLCVAVIMMATLIWLGFKFFDTQYSSNTMINDDHANERFSPIHTPRNKTLPKLSQNLPQTRDLKHQPSVKADTASEWQARLEKFMTQKGLRPEQFPAQDLQALGQQLSKLEYELRLMQTQKQTGQQPSHAHQLQVIYLAFSLRNRLFDLTHLELTDLLQANGVVDGVVAP